MNEQIFLKLEKKIGFEIKRIKAIEPRQGLISDIMSAIYRKMLIRARVKLAILASTVLILLAYPVFYWDVFAAQLSGSETWQLAVMFFSNTDLAIANWKIFALYFLETFPFFPVLLILTIVLLSLGILKFLAEQMAAKHFLAARKRIAFKI